MPAAHAEPRPNAPLPPFAVADITGRTHHTSELRGRPTLIAVLTSKEGGVTKSWMDRAASRYRDGRVRFVTVVSLDLSPFIPTSFVRDTARDRTPRDQWHTTWLDRSGSVRRTLGLPRDHVPYLFVLGPDGKVRQTIHAPYDPQTAQRVWSALDHCGNHP
jgi:hypothetical protein